MTTRINPFRSRLICPKPSELSSPRQGCLPVPQDEDGVYRGCLRGRKIRLLRLLPESTPDSLRYDIDEYGLDSGIAFQALSYSWGDPAQKYSITCNGKEVRIAENLYNALQQFQEDRSITLLWTDALCINQTDLDEKSEQVRLMAEIYKAASEVVVWLGKEKPSDRSGVEQLSVLLEKLGLPEYGEDLSPDPRFSLAKYELPESGDPRWMDMLAVFKRPWFVRTWTVQEFLFAKKSHVRIGSIKISWDQIFAAAVNAARYPRLKTTLYGPCEANRELANILKLWNLKVSFSAFCFAGTKAMTHTKSSFLKRLLRRTVRLISIRIFQFLAYTSKVRMPSWANSKPSLNDLLVNISGRETTNSQDKVFAILALTHDGRVDKIDYQKSISEVLIDAAKMSLGIDDGDQLLPLGASLKFLTSIEARSTIPGLPSWVPDYNSHAEFKGMFETGTEVTSMLQPSLSSVTGLCDAQNTLYLRGKAIDVVDIVYQNDAHEHQASNESQAGQAFSGRRMAEMITSAPEILRALVFFEEDCWEIAKRLGTYPTGEMLREAYWQALACDMTSINAGIGISMKECFEAYHEVLPIVALMPNLFAEAYGLKLGAPVAKDIDASSTTGFEDHNSGASEEVEASHPTSSATEDVFPRYIEATERVVESTHARGIPLPDEKSKISTARANVDEIASAANLTNFTPLPDPVIQRLSRPSTLITEVVEEAPTPLANAIAPDSLWSSPATPEMFVSAGLRVPNCINLYPERSLVEHLFSLASGYQVFEQILQTLPWRRRFGTTKCGYLGWFPRLAREGDIIVVFNGMTIPFVVRRMGEDRCEMVGACYVRGFMNGAAFGLEGREEGFIGLI